MSLPLLSWREEGGSQDSGSSTNFKCSGRGAVQSSRAACRLCRKLWGCSFHESSLMLWWVFFFSNTAAFDSPMQLQNQPINQTSVSNPRKPAGSLTINSFFGLWMAPHLGLIETCSHRPRKCHTMLLLVLLQGELSRGLMSSSKLTLCPPGGQEK